MAASRASATCIRYVAEFEFRYNARKVDDGERTMLAIKKADWKRLRYKEP